MIGASPLHMKGRRCAPIIWLGETLAELRSWSEDVKDDVGSALLAAQIGEKSSLAKPLHGFGGASVLEIKTSDVSGTYRVVYTVKLVDAIYVLHAFQKKSTQGIATAQRDIQLVQRRLAEAIERS